MTETGDRMMADGAEYALDRDVLLQECRRDVPRVLAIAETLVNMDSGSSDLDGLRRKAEHLCECFERRGARAELVEADAPRRGSWNVVSRFKGTGRARILVLTHYDTVFPAGEAARRPFRCDGVNAYGPGVADMQTSIAMVLRAMDLLHDLLGFRDYRQITVFCNADEELGSWGGRRQIMDLAAEHDIALNMELSGADGSLITVSGRGMATGTLTVRGVSAHSAAEPPEGVNAGLELAYQLLHLSHLSDPVKRTAVNATLGSFGSRANVIPDHAEATLNIRVADPAEFARVEREIRRLIQDRLFAASHVSFDMRIDVPPYGNNPKTLELADRVRAMAREELGMELGYRHAIGSNDTSFAAQTCVSLDGFGPGCIAMHTEKECLPVASIAPRLYLFMRMIIEVCRGSMVPLEGGTEEGRRS